MQRNVTLGQGAFDPQFQGAEHGVQSVYCLNVRMEAHLHTVGDETYVTFMGLFLFLEPSSPLSDSLELVAYCLSRAGKSGRTL